MAFISATCEPLRIWSRLEPRSREIDFDDSLSARISDPMFLLGRQWQFGEFAGADAGSAIFATMARQVSSVSVQGAGPDDGVDALTEQLPISFPLVVRARLGRTVLSRLDAAAAANGALDPPYDPNHYRELFFGVFGPQDADPTDPIAVARDNTAPRAVRARSLLRGHSVDGVRVFDAVPADLTAATLPAALAAGIPPGHQDLVLTVLLDYREWFAATYLCPDQNATNGWQGDQLEYATTATASGGATDTQLSAAEYRGGSMDWYSFDQDATVTATSPVSPDVDVRSVFPVPAEFPGMPKPRWWQFEDSAVDLGKLTADATDAARIVVSEFALLYSNDWFTISCRQPVGSIAELQGAIVTDVFGWRTLIKPTVAPAGGDWTGWDAFSLAPRPSGPPLAPLPQHLYLAKTLPHILDGEVTEQVVFVRDETADMVWAIEQRIPDGLDGSRDAAQASVLLRQLLAPDEPAAVDGTATTAALRYILQTEVAENWIPFIPVHLSGQLRAIQLQRGVMRRTIGPTDSLIRPLTSILRPGIDDDDVRLAPYYVHEEEVSQAGVVVEGMLRRGRRYDGTPVVWNARRVGSGRGTGRSGLTFDEVS
jgi:hypothetical protein